MSGGSSSSTTNTLDPTIKSLLTQNYTSAQNVANTPFTPFTGQMVAPLTAMQNQAGQMFGNIATNQTGSAAANSGVSALNGVLGYKPTNVAGQTVNTGLLSNTDLSPYMNPYTNDVINATIAQQERAREMAQTGDAQSASAAGAFGGSRSGVLGALTNQYYDQNTGQLVAGLNSANFSQAQQAALQDIANQNQTGEFNSNTALQASGANAANGLTGNAQRLAAGQGLGVLGQTQLNLAQQQAAGLNAAGLQQQQTQQAQDQANYQEFLRRVNYPLQMQTVRNSALGMFPALTNSTTSQNPGAAGILGASGSFLQGLGALGVGF